MAPSETMLESAAYRRMKAENPSEFVPRSVFFARDGGSGIDRRNSLWVKAALVYESVTGRHVDDGVKPLATSLFLQVARECRSRIPDDAPQTKATVVTDALNKVSGAVATPIAGAGGGEDGSEEKQNKTAELHDEEKESDDKQVIDAVFLVVGFLRRLVKAAEGVSRDAVDEGFKSTHMQDIVTDMIKLENQLPLKLILDVVEHVQDAARAVAADTKFEGLRECLEGYKLGFNPATFFDDVLATVARNLLAREYEEQNKPVTRYFQMMNELVDEAADAKILRRAGAVRGGGASGAEVHELVKRIDGYATYPSVYMAMDVQIAKVRRFHDMRMQNFLVRYRPGVIWASSVAAVSLVAIVAARRRG
uniref:Uncharacterized protein n=1 Tax=Aegilops tauschii TaxID=37682 RepID=M8BZ65_AEGTA